MRKIRLVQHFHECEYGNILRVKCNFQPPQNRNQALEDFVPHCCQKSCHKIL